MRARPRSGRWQSAAQPSEAAADASMASESAQRDRTSRLGGGLDYWSSAARDDGGPARGVARDKDNASRGSTTAPDLARAHMAVAAVQTAITASVWQQQHAPRKRLLRRDTMARGKGSDRQMMARSAATRRNADGDAGGGNGRGGGRRGHGEKRRFGGSSSGRTAGANGAADEYQRECFIAR
ncbi:hypothetical protein Scep_014001 [Stephania cephalantha]|uniref:Uncharacterized protein n=1 Tax=Stephania cephalantha TaxID=152367 RepID=A0AAP0P191_9MAGN